MNDKNYDMIDKYIPFNEQETQDKIVMLKYIQDFDNIYDRRNVYAHMSSSSWIVNKDYSKVLMIYHNIYQSWSWTGGHCDNNNNLLEVAIKEAKEETGLNNLKVLSNNIFSLEILSVDGHFKRGKFVSSHLHLNVSFLLEADEFEPINIKEDENSNIGWFDLDEAISQCSEPYMKKIYSKLNDKLRLMKKEII